MKTNQAFLLAFILFINPGVHSQQRQQVDLNFDWKITSLNAGDSLSLTGNATAMHTNKWYRGDMPKQVQEFILESGELPDPSIQDNAEKWIEIFQKDWIYVKDFNTPEFEGKIKLCLDGLDTEVDVFLNNRKIAYCNNMNRRWRINLEEYINPPGENNRLVLRFYQPQKVIDDFVSRYPDVNVPPRKYIRKCDSDFKSYMGARPHFMKVGVFDNIYLDLIPGSFFGDILVESKLKENFSAVEINVKTDLQGQADHMIYYELISPGDKVIKKGKSLSEDFSIDVDNPELWYPMNFGPQPIYSLKVELRSGKKILDESTIAFGIRDLQIIQKDHETGTQLFALQVNGQKVFMNGACWAPLYGFTHVWNEERADSLLNLMKLGNMNFLRIWGEGTIPGKSLFDFCDAHGIFIMMDFMTCSPLEYPIQDTGFRENITLEIEDVIRRLRNHPSLAFWDGGNEHYLFNKSNFGDNSRPLGREIFQKIMPDAISRLDPQRYFHPSSPWGGDDWFNGNYPLSGDFHDYSTVRFQPLSSVPLFTTEVCQVSPYSVHNMRRFMSEEELWPKDFQFVIDQPGKKAWPPGWEHHSIGSAWYKIGRIQDYCDIQNAADACRVLGAAHGQYLKDRYERQRRGVPDGQPDEYRQSWGAAIWRLNDTWPMIYMSVVDYYLEPKIPYYYLKRACDPVLISFEQTDDRICVWVVNDTPFQINDSLVVELVDFNGKVMKQCGCQVNMGPSESKRAIDLTHEFYEMNKRDEFLVARMNGLTKSHTMFPEKFLNLEEGKIDVQIKGDLISLESDSYITCVEVAIPGVSGAIFTDNYFEMIPGEKKQIKIVEKKHGDQITIKGVNSEMITMDL